jgi:hypothetical protein
LTIGAPRWAIQRRPTQQEKPSHGRTSLLGGRLRQQAQVSIAQVRAHWRPRRAGRRDLLFFSQEYKTMKRSRLSALGAMVALLAVIALAGGGFLRGGAAHAAAGVHDPHVLSRDYLSAHHAHAWYDRLPAQVMAKFHTRQVSKVSKVSKASKVSASHGMSACVPGIQGVSNFCTTFSEPGFDQYGNPNSSWTTNILGNPPQAGGTTTIDAPVVPIKVELLGTNGKPAYISDPRQQVQPTLKSPIFSNTTYDSSPKPTQFTDAEQRAQFHNVETADWHTMLAPSLQPMMTMQIPYGEWYVGLNPDGSVAYTLVEAVTFVNLLIPATVADQPNTIIGRLELNGVMTTKNITSFLFNNVLFYYQTVDNCCILAFHEPDVEPGPNGIWNLNYAFNVAPWLTPGIFGQGLADITGLSHEMAETFNDPFGGDYFPYAYVPWWISAPAGAPFTVCEPLMEVGDVIETYPQSNVVAITMNGMTYHPQIEALLQWFEGQTPSTALHGAYSWPDETFLTSPAVSMQPNCTGPA